MRMLNGVIQNKEQGVVTIAATTTTTTTTTTTNRRVTVSAVSK